MSTITEETPLGVFDLDAHQAEAERRREALTLAEAAEAEAKAEAESKAERVEDLEAEMGSGTVTAAALTKARTEAEISTAKLTAMTARRRAAERAVPNTDTELAEAVAVRLRHSMPSFVAVTVAPVEVPAPPTLPGHLPAVVIEQTEPCHRDPNGWMSSHRNGKPILVRVFSEQGLDLDFGAEDCFAAVALNGVNNVEQLNGRTTTHPGGLVERSYRLPVARAASAMPLITAPEDAASVGTSILAAVKRSLRGYGTSSAPEVTVNEATETEHQDRDGIVTRSFEVRLTFIAETDLATSKARVERHVAGMPGGFFSSIGSVVASSVVSTGSPVHNGSWAGLANVLVSVTTVCRTR